MQKTGYGLFAALWGALVISVADPPPAYGGGHGGHSGGSGGRSGVSLCKGPQFSQVSPADKSTVPMLSEFSFLVSKEAFQTSIKVKIKGREQKITVDKQPDGSYLVHGKLSEPIGDAGFVRIVATAGTSLSCSPVNHGWLVEVKPAL